MELISPNQELGQRSQGGFGFPQAALLGIPPYPIGTALEENQMGKASPTNLTHPNHLSSHTPRSESHCLVPIQNSHETSTSNAELYKLKVKS